MVLHTTCTTPSVDGCDISTLFWGEFLSYSCLGADQKDVKVVNQLLEVVVPLSYFI